MNEFNRKNWLPWQRPLINRKVSERLIKLSHTFNNPENLAKIGPLDSQNYLKLDH